MVQCLGNVSFVQSTPQASYVEGQCQCVSDEVFMRHRPCFVFMSIFVDPCCEFGLQLVTKGCHAFIYANPAITKSFHEETKRRGLGKKWARQ